MDDNDDLYISEKDLNDALHPGSRRKRLTKEQQIYGIWADDDRDDSQQKSKKTATFSKKSTNYYLKKETKAASKPAEDFGSWEKHTTGFGSKMLEKMGFTPGKGLGKSGTGIVEPVQASVREGRATLGAYASDRADDRPKMETTLPTPQSSATEKIAAKPQTWKRVMKADQKYIRKTFEQLIKETKASPSITTETTKVIDMTQPDMKISFGYDTITTPKKSEQTPEQKMFDLPELIYNMELLTTYTEKSLKSHIKRVQIKSDVLATFKHEQTSTVKCINDVSSELSDLSHLTRRIMHLRNSLESEDDPFLQVDIFITSFDQMNDPRYLEFNLDGLIGSVFYPILYTLITTWQPFEDYDSLVNVFIKWRNALKTWFKDQNQDFYTFNFAEDLYEKTLTDLWVPRFYEALSSFDVREVDKIISFINTWRYLLTDKAIDATKQALLSRILAYIESWNPLVDSRPIQTWLESYNEILDKDFENIHRAIMKNLIKSLQNWTPSDPLALKLIAPMKSILNKDQFQAFLARCIVPKLMEFLDKNLIINPRNQVLDPLVWVLTWKDTIDSVTMSNILYRGFAMKWLKILNSWLIQNPKYDDIKRWYSGWKVVFAEFINSPQIQFVFTQALQMIEQSMKGLLVSEPREYVIKTPTPSTTQPNVPRVSLTFKELVENAAADNCIIFTPTAKKRPDGKTIYQFGTCSIYIDRDVIFVEDHTANIWKPISLPQLVQISS